MPVSLILIVILTGLNVVVYGAMATREKIVVRAAIKAERNEGISQCNLRVTELQRIHNEETSKRAADAKRAANLVSATPEDKATLIKICNGSASCRSKGAN